jgi:hypothetical protein
MGRSLLDLAIARPADRLAGIRALAAQASAIAGIGDGSAASNDAADEAAARPGRGRRQPPGTETATGAGTPGESLAPGDVEPEPDEAGPARAPAAERRRAAEALIALWTDVARDVVLCQRGLDRSVRDLALLDDTRALAVRLDPDAPAGFVDRLGRASVLIAGNASPELVLDELALAWPRPRAGSRAA